MPYQEDTSVTCAEELKIKQVIIILLDNAMKYSHDKIQIYLDKNAQYAIIRVKDYSIGILQNEMNIFLNVFIEWKNKKSRNRKNWWIRL